MHVSPHSIEPKQAYKLAIGGVQPRPIALVSTVNEDGSFNLAPYSFFNVACANPLTLVFFPQKNSNKPKGKDSTVNILREKQFVINVVTEANVDKVNITAGVFDYGVDEFKESGLTPVASQIVRAPRVKESPIAFECVLTKHVVLGGPETGSDALFGQVQNIFVEDELVDDFRIDTKIWKPVGRLAGNDYSRSTDVFQVERPG